ncbi:MAG: hypothetical protein OEV00_08535, partial [Acidobacteriota bacterium]|nr:hypothetical protein [Acidobacteriota bacterium]
PFPERVDKVLPFDEFHFVARRLIAAGGVESVNLDQSWMAKASEGGEFGPKSFNLLGRFVYQFLDRSWVRLRHIRR